MHTLDAQVAAALDRLGYKEQAEKLRSLLAGERPKPYDPVAVLEAIPDRFLVCVERSPEANDAEQWWASIIDDSLESALDEQGQFPDFPSAVRWLHEQAATADLEFAQQWPVPEEA